MNTISSIITTLSKDDKKNFVLELKQKNRRHDTKNLQLFQLLEAPEPPNNLDVLLYGKPSKGAYHALCKRLHDSLIDFVATKSFEGESSVEMEVLKLLLACRIFFEHQQVKLAFKTMKKAESKAEKYGLYSILNEVYHTKIQYAHLNDSIDFKALIHKYQQNKMNNLQEENLNLFYASVQHELVNIQIGISDVIKRNLALYNISITKNLSYQSLFKILEISNHVANVTRDYYAVLQFIEDAYQQIETSDRIKDKHLYAHIQILYYMSNAYFRIKNFKISVNYLEEMHSYMSLQSNKHYHVFHPRYTLLENLLLIYTGKAKKAVNNLEAFDFKKHKDQLGYLLDLKLSLVVALFLQQRFKEAFRIYKGFYHSDSWYTNKTGVIWVIKKNLIEIMLLIELDYLDLVGSRLNSFRKKHRTHLIEKKETRVLEFLKLVTIYYYKTEDIHSVAFKEKVDNLLKIKNKNEDVFVISFYAWIRSKIENSDLYRTCIDSINKI